MLSEISFNNRLASHINKTNTCWLWTGAKDKDGYGKMFRNYKFYRSHRYMWEQKNGPIPQGMVACHSCDNPSCVNPAHIFIGTIADNNRDSHFKGRASVGEKHYKAKLTRNQVIEIKEKLGLGVKQSELAKKFSVVHQTISWIANNGSWKCLNA